MNTCREMDKKRRKLLHITNYKSSFHMAGGNEWFTKPDDTVNKFFYNIPSDV